MTNVKNKTTAISVTLILMLATSAALMSVPIGNAATTVNVDICYNQFIGVNSQTLVVFALTPNVLNTDPNLMGKASIWANATVTFTRPDGTKDVVNGPIIVRPDIIGGEAARLYLYYTPNMMGTWNATFYYPGDSTYNAINKTAPFVVIGAIPRRTPFTMLSIKPYPNVGLGQDILINAWITPPPLTDRQNFEGFMFTFTRPDGTSFTVGPMDSEGPGTVWFNLPLDALGNWSIKFEFPGDYSTLPGSVTRYITVQQDAIPTYPDTPLPTEPWDYPINIQNREWRKLGGIWAQSSFNASEGSFNPYTEGPRTAHILWKIPSYGQLGGYIGSPQGIQTGGGQAEYGGETAGIYTSSTYSINTIMAGRGYSNSGGNITCFDIHTGKILWQKAGASFNVGTSRGRTAALYSFSSTRFIAYDAITGAILNNVTGMSMAFFVNPYVYTVQSLAPVVIQGTEYAGPSFLIKWDASSTTTNFTSRIVWNITNILPSTSTSHSLIVDNLWIARHFWGLGETAPSTSNTIIVDYMTAINLTTGKTEWNVTTMDSTDPNTYIYRQGPAWGSGEGLVYFAGFGNINNGLGYVAFKTSNGQLAWWSPPTDYPWGNFWAYQPQASGYGQVYGLGYSGIYAFNATNGKINWHYIDNDPYFEEPYASNIAPDGSTYASYSFGSTGPIVGGGVLYAVQSEHSPTFYYRGYGMVAVDVFTGEELFKINGVYSLGGIADGVLVMSDSQNGMTYAWGKGESATTVSASSKVIAKGNSILLEGTVLDMSEAQKGTAAVADAYQTEWMEYLHMQQPFPHSATGVSVSLDALDSNNNYIHIGDAVSDTTGQYSLGWEPEIEGKYTIVASFYSTEAYYGSEAETSIYVQAAPATTPPPENQPVADNTPILYAVIGIGIAILIAIAIVGLLLIKKRA
jgi:outer membrane protein assembly factor BamB